MDSGQSPGALGDKGKRTRPITMCFARVNLQLPAASCSFLLLLTAVSLCNVTLALHLTPFEVSL